MPQAGTGPTTDNTNTENEIYFAGDAIRIGFDVGTGGKVGSSKRTQTPLTGYDIVSSAVWMDVEGGDLAKATPHTQNTPVKVALSTSTSNLGEGKFYAYLPKNILKTVGMTVAPVPGSPVYLAVTTEYTEASTITDPETRTVASDIYAFRWNANFDITA